MNTRAVPPFPLNPNVGQRWGDWVWNGASWICSPATGVQVLKQYFLQNGTYMPSPGLVTAFVQLVGPGGGAGGVLHANGWNGGGGGGGSGGYSEIYLPAASVLGGVVVTCAAVGGSSTAFPGVNPPQAGPPTTFGGFCLAYGGVGGVSIGQGGTVGQTGEGGAGGQVGIGALALRGNAGGPGSYANVGTVTPPIGAMYGGAGGVPPMLGGGVGRRAVIFAAGFMAGTDAYTGNPQPAGCGGNGGVAWSGASDIGGGNGGGGICLVTEYCWSDVPPGVEDCCPPSSGARVAIGQGWAPHGEFNDD
jgi:hypothetical protein